MKEIKFTNIEEYRNYLSEKLGDINQTGKYNIFIHCVTNHTAYFGRRLSADEDRKLKIEGIMTKGLDLNGASYIGSYGSINGTAKFVGELDCIEKFDRIINYDYLSYDGKVCVIIMTIPKFLDLGDSIIEFSSVDGDLDYHGPHKKECVLDISKGNYLSPSFNLGCQTIDKNEGTITFIENEEHFSKKSKKEMEQEMKSYVQRVQEVLKEEGKDEPSKRKIDWKKIFTRKTKEHEEIISDALNDI